MKTMRLGGWLGAGVLSLAMIGCGSERAGAPVAASTLSPYAGKSSASVPSLTEQEVSDLLAGRGLGMARAAELNGYPGPRHVLDLQTALGLDGSAVDRAQQLFEEMQSEAKPLGEQVVALEKALGEAFAAQTVDESALAAQVEALGKRMAQLREIHLRAHIRMRAVLTPQQVARYQELRGYATASATAGAGADAHGAHHHAM